MSIDLCLWKHASGDPRDVYDQLAEEDITGLEPSEEVLGLRADLLARWPELVDFLAPWAPDLHPREPWGRTDLARFYLSLTLPYSMAGMVELARRWCRILGINPRRPTQVPTANPGEFAGRLADAITDYLAAAHGLTSGDYTSQQIPQRHAAPATWTLRDPTDAERQAARQLAAQLRHARTRQPEPATRPSAVPPGRLRTCHAITHHAQIAAGAIPTAAPWQRRATTPPHKPALRLAVLVDVSGSMRAYAQPLSAAAWILAHAARRTDAVTTTIAFADTVTLLTPPRQRPTHVLEMNIGGGTSTFTDAVKLADQLLDLRHRTTVRMLAVVSDGKLPDKAPAQKLITALHQNGCAILWLHPADLPQHVFQDTTAITIADPVDAIGHIAQAAVHALAIA